MLGSMLRLDNIRPDKTGVWIIQFTLCTDQDQHFKSIFDHTNHANGEGETTLISFGNVLRRMGKFNEAKKYCRRYLNQLPSHDHRNIARCCHAIGSVAYEKGEYESSLEWLHKSLEMIMQTDDPDLANTLNCIANVYAKKNDYKKALDLYNKASIIFSRVFGEDDQKVAMCFNNIGVALEKEEKYSEALEYYEKALVIRQKCLPADHSRFGQSYNNIGRVHQLLGHCDLALEYYNLSLEIGKKSLPPQHPYCTLQARSRISAPFLRRRMNGKKHCRTMKKRAPSIVTLYLPPIPMLLKSNKISDECCPKSNYHPRMRNSIIE
ncbi:unnamed protein product [Sphagnum troendelagicum]|uniref:Photosystem I assembly protein Ycf3 n=1 Tax=Sphagnum troendelagicum TaxID=128251 RepID=A0ABP0T763_9BRYO